MNEHRTRYQELHHKLYVKNEKILLIDFCRMKHKENPFFLNQRFIILEDGEHIKKKKKKILDYYISLDDVVTTYKVQDNYILYNVIELKKLKKTY